MTNFAWVQFTDGPLLVEIIKDPGPADDPLRSVRVKAVGWFNSIDLPSTWCIHVFDLTPLSLLEVMAVEALDR